MTKAFGSIIHVRPSPECAAETGDEPTPEQRAEFERTMRALDGTITRLRALIAERKKLKEEAAAAAAAAALLGATGLGARGGGGGAGAAGGPLAVPGMGKKSKTQLEEMAARKDKVWRSGLTAPCLFQKRHFQNPYLKL